MRNEHADMLICPRTPLPFPGVGVVENMPGDEYHQIAAVNASMLKEAGVGDDELCWADIGLWRQGNYELPTYALYFGQAAHTALLEGRFEDIVEVEKWVNPLTGKQNTIGEKCAGEALAAAAAAHPGQNIVAAGDYQTIVNMVEACKREPRVGALLEIPSRRELSIFWIDDETDLPCKARLDWWIDPTEKHPAICVDYKTAQSVRRRRWQQVFFAKGYYMSAAHYAEGVVRSGLASECAFRWLAQEKSKTYQCRVWDAPEEVFECGRKFVRDLLRGFARCYAEDRWPGYPSQTETVTAPMWMIERAEYQQRLEARMHDEQYEDEDDGDNPFA